MTKVCQSNRKLYSREYASLPGFLPRLFPVFFHKRISSFVFLLLICTLLFLKPLAVLAAKDGEHAAEKMRGQRLFYGLIDGKFEDRACADCHNTVEIDTFNWNPNAWEIANKYKEKSIEEFTTAVMNPTGRTMSIVHQSFNLEESDIELIKYFLDEFEKEGLSKRKPIINKILLFILLGVVLTWIVLDVLFFKKVKRKWILGLLFGGALAWQISLLLDAGISLGRQQYYEPDQPVKFSHAVHVADNQIDCKYCHHTAEFSKSAGFPEVNLCMNCHILVREGTYSGMHEISKVVMAYETGQPIEWVRIHNLHDHAFFSHAQHVTLGKIECQTCHGPIEEMHRVRQVEDLSMGWCVNCHRDTEVQFFDNEFYKAYEKMHDDFKSGKIDKVTVESIGGTECSKCHY